MAKRDSIEARDGVVTFTDLELHHEPPLEDWERTHPEIVMDPDRCAFLCKRDHAAETNRTRGAVARSHPS